MNSLRLQTLVPFFMAMLVAMALALSYASAEESCCASCPEEQAHADIEDAHDAPDADDAKEELAEQRVDGCDGPCPGEDEDGHCADDCAFCTCCGAPAPATLATVPVLPDLPPDVVERPTSLDPPMSRARGIPLGIFKPPRTTA